MSRRTDRYDTLYVTSRLALCQSPPACFANFNCYLFFFYDNRKQSDGLFLHVCTEMAKLYPNIEFSNMIIDNCAMQVSDVSQQVPCRLVSLYEYLWELSREN